MDYELIKLIKQAESIKGSGSQLISVYIPGNSNLQQEIAKLQNEYSGADRIQSKQTKSGVKDGLQRMIGRLKEYKDLKNGIALFSAPGELLVYEPSSPLNVSIYSCDADFVLEPLYNLLRPQQRYCLVVLDGKEATIARLTGSDVKIVKYMESLVPSKTNSGGQSAARYHRVIEQATKGFYQRIAEVINKEYLSSKFDWLICGGAGFSKDSFLKEKLLNYQIKVKDTVDVGYTDENGIYELIKKADNIFKDDEIAIEDKMFLKFKDAKMNKTGFSGEEAKEKLSFAKQILISRDLVGKIDLNDTKADIFVIDNNNPSGKEFLLGQKGFGIIV